MLKVHQSPTMENDSLLIRENNQAGDTMLHLPRSRTTTTRKGSNATRPSEEN